MARARFQVLILPFYREEHEVKYCIFHRSRIDMWQFIAGGGEDNETHLEAAKRECYEEARLESCLSYHKLDTLCSISSECFKPEDVKRWGEDCFTVPEYSFAVEVKDTKIQLSHEHTEYEWVDYETAIAKLKHDSNKVALWELDNRIKKGKLATL